MPMLWSHSSPRPLLRTASYHRQHAASMDQTFSGPFGSNLDLRCSAVHKATHWWLEKEVSWREKALLAECSHHWLSCMADRDGNKPPAVFPAGAGPIRGHIFSHLMSCIFGGLYAPCLGLGSHQRFWQKSGELSAVPSAELFITFLLLLQLLRRFHLILTILPETLLDL